MTIDLSSTAFSESEPIPQEYTGEGSDLSPPLGWSDVPQGTRELALVCDDPDAPTSDPWVHWVIYGLAPQLRELPEGLPRRPQLDHPPGARQGKNSWPRDDVGYRGPMPPPGHGVHHYHFTLYALDIERGLEPGATKRELLQAVDGHVLGTGKLIGTYQR